MLRARLRSSHVRRNLRSGVDDQAEKFGLSPELEFRMARTDLGLERSGLSYLRIAPGFRMPFGHRHAEQEEVYVLVDGGARLKLDDEVLEMRSWDAVRIAKDTVRALEGGPEDAVLILFGAPRTDADDAELVQGWWAE